MLRPLTAAPADLRRPEPAARPATPPPKGDDPGHDPPPGRRPDARRAPTPRRAAMGERFFAVRRLDGGGRSAFLRGYRIGRRLPMNQADADEPGGPGIGSAVSTDTTLAAAEIGCVARRREHRRPPEN